LVVVAKSLAPEPDSRAVEVIEFVISEANVWASLTAELLQQLVVSASPDGDKPVPQFTRGFLLELGAILRIHVWERSGLRKFVRTELPPAREALSNLFARAARGHDPEDTAIPLVTNVLRAALEHSAWRGRRDLGADIVLDTTSEDRLLNVLADFLWANRSLAR
jgi:hypothetical protein